MLHRAEGGEGSRQLAGGVVHRVPEVVVLGPAGIVGVGDPRVVGIVPVGFEPNPGAGYAVAVGCAGGDAVLGIGRGLVADHLTDATQGDDHPGVGEVLKLIQLFDVGDLLE